MRSQDPQVAAAAAAAPAGQWGAWAERTESGRFQLAVPPESRCVCEVGVRVVVLGAGRAHKEWAISTGRATRDQVCVCVCVCVCLLMHGLV